MAKAKATTVVESPVEETVVVNSEPVSVQGGFKPEDFQGAPSRAFENVQVETSVDPIEPPVVL